MDPRLLGTKYDKIAKWWHERQLESDYGVSQVDKALSFAVNDGMALDIGCGAGGRFIRVLDAKGYKVTGIDVSVEMIKLARENHPGHNFIWDDIVTWETQHKFDFILAWDSIFHLPLDQQKPVLSKLVTLLNQGGILIYTFGNAEGEHDDQWHDDTFHYSSIGINENLQTLIGGGLKILHLELDQYPEKHVYIIAQKA